MLALTLYLLAISLVVSLLLVPVARWLSHRFGVLDHPVGKKQQKRPMPLLGGLAIFLTVCLVVGVHLAVRPLILAAPRLMDLLPHPVPYMLDIYPDSLARLGVILGGAALVFLVGLIDDAAYFGIKGRLTCELIIAIGVTSFGIRPELLGVPPVITWSIAVLWIVGVTNAFNLLDGMDGMAAGVAIISGGLMAAFCFLTGQVMVGMLLVILCGASAGFLRHNWNPATIYMGSCGSLFLGYMLATVPLVVAFMQTGSGLAAVAMPILILSVPLYDTFSVMFIRVYNGRSPVSPDHNHLFHRLRRLGLSVKQVVVIVYFLAFAVGLSAMQLIEAKGWEAALIVLHILAMYAVFVVIEMTGVRLRDRDQVVCYRARYFFPERTGEERPPRDAHVRMLTGDSAEIEVPARDLPAFCDALGRQERMGLEIRPAEDLLEPVTAVCAVSSVLRLGPQRGFVGLVFQFRDAWEMRHVKATIAALLYPDRATQPARPPAGAPSAPDASKDISSPPPAPAPDNAG